jgi:hypothetical protein
MFKRKYKKRKALLSEIKEMISEGKIIEKKKNTLA